MFLQTADAKIYYDLIGDSHHPVVCLVHSLASDSGMWAEQVGPLLAVGFRVLRVDIRGHGGSEATAAPYNLSGLARDIDQVLEALDLSAVHYVGLSIGGMMGEALAISHPGRLRSVTICDALPSSPPNAKELWAPRISAARQAKSLAPVADDTMQRWLSAGFKEKNSARWRQIYDTIRGTSVEGFAGGAGALQDFDFMADLAKVKLPALVICGADDPGPPPAANRKIAEPIPDGIYEEIPATLHFPNVEAPDAFNKILLAWLKRHA
jgi:3-oxoadipate enol-lactonase